MNHPNLLITAAAILLAAGPFSSGAALADAPQASFQAVTDAATAAGNAFLATLDDAQRRAVLFEFRDSRQRHNWSNLPAPMVRRKGLRFGDLKEPQLAAAHKLLQSLLSPRGYEKVLGIMDGDEVLKREGGPGGLVFGRDEYYISFLGRPSSTEPWMLQWGGHHLALNLTVDGPHATIAPSHTAAQPSRYTLNGREVRPLGAEYDKAFALMDALDESQRKKAILSGSMGDLALGPGHDGEMLDPEGLKASGMTAAQQALLLDTAREWVGILHESAAGAKMAELKANIAETWFSWSGPTTKGKPAYYRIQGPTVFIEFSPQHMGGDPVNHIHTMYRDPLNDYGKQWWKK